MTPGGSVAGLTVMTGHPPGPAIPIEYGRLPGQPFASVAVIVKLNVPAAVGVPEMTPLDELRVRPFGSAPLESVKVYGAVPPTADTVWLYGEPIAPLGSVEGFTVMIGHGLVGPQMATLLLSIVTAPFRARARPEMFAPVVSVMLESARMFPMKLVPVPSVAELPTCQNTLQLLPLPGLITTMDEPLAVVRELPILKMKSALGLPRALRVSVPVNWAEDEKQ